MSKWTHIKGGLGEYIGSSLGGWTIFGSVTRDPATLTAPAQLEALDIAAEALGLLEEAHDHRFRKMHVGRDWDDWEERIVSVFLAKHRAEEKTVREQAEEKTVREQIDEHVGKQCTFPGDYYACAQILADAIDRLAKP